MTTTINMLWHWSLLLGNGHRLTLPNVEPAPQNIKAFRSWYVPEAAATRQSPYCQLLNNISEVCQTYLNDSTFLFSVQLLHSNFLLWLQKRRVIDLVDLPFLLYQVIGDDWDRCFDFSKHLDWHRWYCFDRLGSISFCPSSIGKHTIPFGAPNWSEWMDGLSMHSFLPLCSS